MIILKNKESREYVSKKGKRYFVGNFDGELIVINMSGSKIKPTKEILSVFKPKKPFKAKKNPPKPKIRACKAYCDGSYNPSKNIYGYGVVIITDSGKVQKFHGTGTPPKNHGKNINGEIAGSIAAIKRCIKLGARKVTVYHDFMGIGAWATGVWRANKSYTKKYVKDIEKLRKSIEIDFVHVKAHSGNKYNQMADREAAIGAGFEISESPCQYAKKTKLPKGLNEEGRKSIAEFMSKKERSFIDFASLKTGGLDAFSKLKKDELEKMISKEDRAIILSKIESEDEKYYVKALRWRVRGLCANDAARAVNVFAEITNNAISSQISSKGV